MAQQTQPVAQQQQQQQPQQQQPPPPTAAAATAASSVSTPTTPQTLPNNNNNNNSNTNNSNNIVSATSNNINNNNNSVLAQVPLYNQPPPQALYMPQGHGGHHPHMSQGAAMFQPQAVIPAPMSSNVYVHNVTANVNLHGWPQTCIQGGGAPPHYLGAHGELPPEQVSSFLYYIRI